MSLLPWKITNKKLELKARIFKYHTISAQRNDGKLQGHFDFLEFSNWVNIIAINENDEVYLVRQFRAGIKDFSLEIPGGAVDPGEDFLVAAQRELEEEVGIISDDWTLIGEVDPNPSFQGNQCRTYLAKNCKEEGKQNFDPLEDIEVIKMPISKLPLLISSGEIKHSLVIAALYFYQNH